MPAKTSAASASCGTHFGLTKLVASIERRLVAESRSTRAILSALLTRAGSFWSPSRGPTSTIRTCAAVATSILQREQDGVGVDEVALARQQPGHHAVARRLEREFHLHRLHHQQLLPLADAVPR